MARRIIEPSLKKQIFAKYNNKCYVCEYSINSALRVHHIIPIHLGGKENIDNAVLLCSNCHTLVHFYSSKRYRNKEINTYLNSELTDKEIVRLKKLVEKIQNVRKVVEENRNVWVTRKPYTLEETIDLISRKNKFTEHQKNLLTKIVRLVLENIPDQIAQKCSYRLLKNGKYMSINLMNYLLFRTPAYGDFGEKPEFDCYFIFPKNKIPSKLEHVEKRDVFNFKYIDCINIGLSYTEVLKFSNTEWNLFKEACEMLTNAKKTRDWISNIYIDAKDETVA
jgi:hypothetical protein